MKRLFVTAAVLVALLAIGLTPGGSASSPLDVTVLTKQAKKLVRSKAAFRRAKLLEADGTPGKAKRKVKTATQIVNWRFVFNNQGSKSKYASVFVKTHNGKFGKVKGSTHPVLEDQVIKKVPKMTLTRAIKRLRAAGYRRAFFDVTLRKPLYPGVTAPSYFFTMRSGYVAVNTKTGKVQPVS